MQTMIDDEWEDVARQTSIRPRCSDELKKLRPLTCILCGVLQFGNIRSANCLHVYCQNCYRKEISIDKTCRECKAGFQLSECHWVHEYPDRSKLNTIVGYGDYVVALQIEIQEEPWMIFANREEEETKEADDVKQPVIVFSSSSSPPPPSEPTVELDLPMLPSTPPPPPLSHNKEDNNAFFELLSKDLENVVMIDQISPSKPPQQQLPPPIHQFEALRSHRVLFGETQWVYGGTTAAVMASPPPKKNKTKLLAPLPSRRALRSLVSFK